ncbi:hypothetical protein [Dokdonia sp.]|uniref:hypothetical protein n=1 Tax=Dokdonia sp. TaxID=2024995 RepID=UPI003266762D
MASLITRRTTSSIVFVVLACFSPFLHLFARVGQEGVLHWRWMASFLDSIGWALFAFFIGISMLIDIKQVNQELKPAHRIKAYLVTCIGLFYIAYTFIAIKDFTNAQYYSLLSGIAIGLTVFAYLTNKYYTPLEEKLKVGFSKMYHWANSIAPSHVPDTEHKKYFEEFDEFVDEIDI